MKKRYPSSIAQIFILAFSSLIICVPLFLVFEYRLPEVPQDFKNAGIFVLLFLSFYFIAFIVNKRSKLDMKINMEIVHFPSLILSILVILFFHLGLQEPINTFLMMPAQIKMMSTGTAIGAVILAPVCEELVFREIILKGLLTKYSPKMSIFISALLFSLMHLNESQFLGAVSFGLFAGWIYYRTNSLGFVMLLHAASNFIAVTVQWLLIKNFENYSEVIKNPLVIGVVISSVVMLLVCSRHLFKKSDKLNSFWFQPNPKI